MHDGRGGLQRVPPLKSFWHRRGYMPMYRWPQVPLIVYSQVQGYTCSVREALGGNLLGIYLHGSLAMGCPRPVTKDIDLLFLTQQGLPAETKRQMAELVQLPCPPWIPWPLRNLCYTVLRQTIWARRS